MAIACDSASLVRAATCFDCIPPLENLGAQTYLLATKAGITDYKALVTQAKCFTQCIPRQYQTGVQNYLLGQILSVGTGTQATVNLTPSALVAAGKCFEKCIPPGLMLGVQTYCLAVLAGGSTDPKVLLQAAKCFIGCITPQQELSVQVYLLCLIVNGGNTGLIGALDWAARVEANGGATPKTTTVAAIATFYTAINNAGLVSLYRTLNVVAPDSDIAARTPLIVGNGRGLYLGGGGGFSKNGYTAVGSSLRTGINPFAIYGSGVGSTGGWSVYIYSPDSAAPQTLNIFTLGCRSTALTRYCNFNPRNTVDFMAAQLWGIAAGSDIPNSATPTPSAGYYSCNRSGANNLDFEHAQSGYPHAVVYNRVGAEASSPPNAEFYFCGENKDLVDTVDVARTQSYMAFHDAFTPSQSLAEFNAVQALRIAFGGGYN